MEPSVVVAIVGLCGVFVTSAAGVVVAIITNRKEKGHAAESGVERALRERLALRDEQIADLKEENEEQRDLIGMLRQELKNVKGE